MTATAVLKFNPNHDKLGQFASRPSGRSIPEFTHGREAAKWAEEAMPGTRWSGLADADSQVAREVVAMALRINSDFPKIMKHEFKGIGVKSSEFGSNDLGNTEEFVNVIQLNPKLFGHKADLALTRQKMEKGERDGIIPPGAAKAGAAYVFAHEFGHIMAYKLARAEPGELSDWMYKMRRHPDLADELSSNAGRSNREAFADAFASRYVTPSKNRPQWAKDLDGIIDRKYAGVPGYAWNSRAVLQPAARGRQGGGVVSNAMIRFDRQGLASAPVQQAAHTGAMLAFYLPRWLSERLAAPADDGGESPGDTHVTLAYLGEAADLTFEQRQYVLDIASMVAATSMPMEAWVSGTGRFEGEPDGKDVCYASIDAPLLPRFRETLVEYLEGNGVPVSHEHGFTPHATVAYVDPADDCPCVHAVEDLPRFALGALSVCLGDERRDFPLGIALYSREEVDALCAEIDAEVRRRAEAQRPVLKFNPYHDKIGRFAETPGVGTSSSSIESGKPLGFSDPVKAVAWQNEHWDSWRSSLSWNENFAMNVYQTGRSLDINAYLRDPKKNPNGKNAYVGVGGIGKDLDSAIAKGKVPQSVWVTRGVKGSGSAAMFEKLKQGTVFSDKGYVSTALDRGYGEVYRGDRGGILRILVPKGTHAAAAIAGELVLGRNTHFKVTGMRGNPDNWEATLEVQS